MLEFDLGFSPTSSTSEKTFKLLELPSDLCKLIEGAFDGEPLSLNIRGHANEDAVLCTQDRTYGMRSISLSNTVLIVSPPPDNAAMMMMSPILSSTDAAAAVVLPEFGENAVVIRDQVNEIVELAPVVPRLHKLGALLKGREYDGLGDDEIDDGDGLGSASSWKKFGYVDALAEIQASEAELKQGLKARRILEINGELRPISLEYLSNILQIILNTLVSLSLSPANAPVEEVCSALADEHEVGRAVSTQVMKWFGDIRGSKWTMDVQEVVKELGLGILRAHKEEPLEIDVLIARWKSLVGDTFESSVSLPLLEGNYIMATNSTEGARRIRHFPASTLPTDPAARFVDLFLTRSRWKADEIAPFLSDIAVDSKERDKLLIKYARSTTDAQGTWYMARAQYNG